MKLKTKGMITSMSIKGGEVKITLDVGLRNISTDELAKMIDKTIGIVFDDEQATLDT